MDLNLQGHTALIQAVLKELVGISEIVKKANHVDILINNAGSIPAGELETIDENMWRKAWRSKSESSTKKQEAFFEHRA